MIIIDEKNIELLAKGLGVERIQKKKIGGGKLFRTEIVTIRLDPQLRYFIELAARKQRRTISSFIEWILEQSLNTIELSGPYIPTMTIAEVKHTLWDVDEAERFIKLAFHYPEMLTHEEQLRWKLIKENGYLWRGKYDPEWTWRINEEKLNLERLRENWGDFCAVAAGKADKNILPTWAKYEKSSFDHNDDIPF